MTYLGAREKVMENEIERWRNEFLKIRVTPRNGHQVLKRVEKITNKIKIE